MSFFFNYYGTGQDYQRYSDTGLFTVVSIISIAAPPAVAVLYGKDATRGLALSYSVGAIIALFWGLIGFSMQNGVPIGSQVIGSQVPSGTINGIGPASNPNANLQYSYVFFDFMYALLSMSIIAGGIGQYYKLNYFMIFIIGSLFINYLPLACWFWNTQGWAYTYGIYDYSGAMVMHTYAGLAVLFLGLLARFHGKKDRVVVNFGTFQCLLSSFGFFVGKQALQFSNPSFDGSFSSLGSLNTIMSCYVGVLVYNFCEFVLPNNSTPSFAYFGGKATLAGCCKGAMVGIVAISGGAGFMFPEWAVLNTLIVTILVYSVDYLTKHVNIPGWECFIHHGITGMCSAAVSGLLAQKEAFQSSQMQQGSWFGNAIQLGKQCAGISTVILITSVVTLLLYALLVVVALPFAQSIFDEEEAVPRTIVYEEAVPQTTLYVSAGAEQVKAEEMEV